jgi:hypothetical protein
MSLLLAITEVECIVLGGMVFIIYLFYLPVWFFNKVYSDGVDYPYYIIKDKIFSPSLQADRTIGQQEWAVLADLENHIQDEIKISTSMFTTLAVRKFHFI